MKTIVVGLGNPILSDDAVGIKAARLLRDELDGDIDVVELYAGGIRLMDAVTGYDRAVIIDAATTGGRPGTISRLETAGLIDTRNTSSSHDTDLSTALLMGGELGLKMPSDIRVWAVEASDVETFGEELTEDVKNAMPELIEKIMLDLAGSAAHEK